MNRTPLILIHGFPLDSTMWDATRAILESSGVTIITPNLPGFGGTDPLPGEKPTIDDYAAMIAAIIAGLPGKKAIVGGFSMGGYISLTLLREHPALLAGLMLIDTRPDADTADTKGQRDQNIELVKTQGVAALAENMLPKLLTKTADAGLKESVRTLIGRQSVKGITQALVAMRDRADHSALLPSLKLPVLIVVGDSDTLTPRSVAIGMHNVMPHAMLVQVAKAAHGAPLEQPESVASAIKTFLTVMR
jgi:3-oxoadipate enol-lactonase